MLFDLLFLVDMWYNRDIKTRGDRMANSTGELKELLKNSKLTILKWKNGKLVKVKR